MMNYFDYLMQCEGDLVCFFRKNTEPVPFCSGQGLSGKDYCTYLSPTMSPTSSPTHGPSMDLKIQTDLTSAVDPVPILINTGQGLSQYGLCEGDCDRDSDVRSGVLIWSFRWFNSSL